MIGLMFPQNRTHYSCAFAIVFTFNYIHCIGMYKENSNKKTSKAGRMLMSPAVTSVLQATNQRAKSQDPIARRRFLLISTGDNVSFIMPPSTLHILRHVPHVAEYA